MSARRRGLARVLLAVALGLILWIGPADRAQAQCPPPDPPPNPDLDCSAEIDLSHPEILSKAQELATPLAAFKFVRNEIEYQVYYGSKKGALGTLRSGTGNSFDQASLLIALLRAQGIPARYVLGVVDVDVDQLKQWSGIRDGDTAGELFEYHYCLNDTTQGACAATPKLFELIRSGAGAGPVVSARMEHAWVEAQLPARYRGLAVDGAAPTWLPMDPSWKQKAYRTPIPLPIGNEVVDDCPTNVLCFDYDAYYSKVETRTAAEIWEQQIQDWLGAQPEGAVPPGATAEDAIYDGPIIPFEDEVLPLSLPFIPAPVPAVFSDLAETDPAEVQRRFFVAVGVCRDGPDFGTACDRFPDEWLGFPALFTSAELVGKRLTFAFLPYGTSAESAWLEFGGPFGSWPNGSGSALEYCTTVAGSDPRCHVIASLMVDGVEVWISSFFWALGSITPPSIYVDRDVIPGFFPYQIYPVEFTDHVGIAVDVDQAGPTDFRNRTEALLAAGRQLTLFDEEAGDACDDGGIHDGTPRDANCNGISGELLLDQGLPGITSCPTFNIGDPSDPWGTCDIALDAKFPTPNGPGYDDLLGELLHIAAGRYFERENDESGRVRTLDGFHDEISANVGIARAGRTYTYLFGRAIGVEPGAPVFDFRTNSPWLVDIDGDPDPSFERERRERRLRGHTGSAFEHLVWEELVGTEFVSTVKGIQLVRERFPEQPVQVFSGSSPGFADGVLRGFPFDTMSDGAIDDIEAFAIDPNHTVTTPIAAVAAGASTLDVYITESHKTTPPIDISIGTWIRIGGGGASGSCQLQECVDPFADEEPLGVIDLILILLSRLRAISIGSVDVDASFPPPQDPSGVGETLAGDPVSMVSGNLHHTERDLVLPTDGPSFSLARTYNSQIDDAGALGVGWIHNYEMRVEPAQDTRVFTYLPTSLSGFQGLDQVAGPRSDTFDTSNVGTGGVETVLWGVLPTPFFFAVQGDVESITLELAYSGNGSTVTLNTGQPAVSLVSPPAGAPFAFKSIELEDAMGNPYVSLAPAIQADFSGFDGADRLYYARLRIRYRGPAVERVPLEADPSAFSGWTDGGAALRDDDDPSTCSPLTGDQATIGYLSPGTLDGTFGYELIASVARSPGGTATSTLYRGTAAAGEPFATGPVVGSNGARQRFMTTNTAQQLVVTFDRDLANGGNPANQLCLVSYQALTLPPQVEFVREDGARERFTKRAGVWEAASGGRSVLQEIVGGYQITRADGQVLRFEQAGAGGAFHLTRISDPQGRSLDLTYVSGRLDRVIWTNSPSGVEALTFRYTGAYLDYVEDWATPSPRRWDFTVDGNGDLTEVRDPLESANNWTGTTYEYLSGETNEKLNHNLRRITFPKDVVAPAGGDHIVEFEYDNSDRVISQTDRDQTGSLSNRQTFAYNAAGQGSQTTDPRGFTTTYRYDPQANLTQRVDPDGAVWTWAYDGDRNVTSETDPFGKTRFFSGHDARTGNPATITDRDGRSVQLTYDPVSGALATITDKRGNVRTTQFSQGQPERVTATLGAGTPLLLENAYDPTSRRLDKTFRPFGDGSGREAITVFSYFPGNRDIRFIDLWDDDGDRVLGEPEDEQLFRTEFEYDGLGRQRARTIQRAKAPADPSPIPIRTEVQRNLRGQIERVIRPDGATWVFEYDRNENLQAQFLEVTTPGGTLVEHQRLDFRYDVLDRLDEVEDALGGITRFEYDAAGNRIATIDPEGGRSRVEYDSRNRPVHRIDANGAVTTTEFDATGRIVAETDPTEVTTRRSYDEIGFLASLQVGGNQAATRTVIYDDPAAGDLRHELIDPNGGNPTKFVFDDLGRITHITDAGTPAGLTQLEYDLHDNLTRFTDPEGGETRFVFDAADRIKKTQPPYATGLSVTEYDETGNAIRVTKPDACQIEMTYDVMGQLVDRVSTACPGDVAPIHDEFSYDARGNLVVARNSHVGLIREYDELDRLVREIDERFGTAVGYVYDAASRVTSKVYPDGSVGHSAYDPAGRTVGVTDPFGDITRYVYDAAGRRLQTRGTSGLQTDLRYDADGRLALIENRRADGSLATTHGYGLYDDAGNLKQIVDGLGSTTYEYDALHRLASFTPPSQPTTHFGYDRAGNRTRSGNQVGGSWTAPFRNYNYANAPGNVTHRITGVTDHNGAPLQSFPIYDANGNPTQWDVGGTRTLRWDALGRLAAIEGGFAATYAYDPFGRRIAKTEQGITVRYQYDGVDAVAEYDGANVLQATYLFGPGIDEPIKIERGGTVAAFHSDALGSVVAVSAVDSPSGNLATYRYDPFGDNDGTTGGFEHPYGFSGRERDASGLYYYRTRYYLPSIGRFLTPDPIGLAGGVNPYSYVNSNPVNFRDPFGLVPGEPGANETHPTIPEPQAGDAGTAESTSKRRTAGETYRDANAAGVAEVEAARKEIGYRPEQHGWKLLHAGRAYHWTLKVAEFLFGTDSGVLGYLGRIIATPFVTLGGILYELHAALNPFSIASGELGRNGQFPLDKQNPLSLLFDTVGDLVANTYGQIISLIPGLSPASGSSALQAARYIPGPHSEAGFLKIPPPELGY